MRKATKMRIENLMSESLIEKIDNLDDKPKQTVSYDPVADDKDIFFTLTQEVAGQQFEEKRKQEKISFWQNFSVLSLTIVVLVVFMYFVFR